MVPKPNFEPLRRDCYRVSLAGEEDMTFTRVPFSSLAEDDLFTLEASCASSVDPIAGTVAMARLYRATSEPYMSQPVDGEWLIDCERM